MNLRNPRLWIAVLTGGVVLGMAIADLGRTAPGPVATVHGQLAAIDGGESCRQCHGGLFSTMTAACLDCHAPITLQLEGGKGVHGQLGKERVKQCALCHSEHHGADFRLVNAMSFAQAGLGDPNTFDHDQIGFAMRGRHLELACAACHPLSGVPVLREGERRFLGLQQDCTTCHLDAHGGRMQLACASCHGQASFQQLESADHDKVLPLIGGHAGVACATCHAYASPHSLTALGEKKQPAQQRTCADCHDSPHTTAFVAATATTSGKSAKEACAVCHLAEHDSFGPAAALLTAEQHAHAGFALAAPHDQAACVDCHAAEAVSFDVRHPGRGQDDCRACHEDPHGGQFDGDPLAPNGCIDCHERTRFAPPTFGVDQHARAGLALEDSHVAVDCHRCHLQASSDEPRTFRGTSTQCDVCHGDAHDGFFTAVAAARPRQPHGTCAHCHAPGKFATPLPGFDHGAWTGFPLAGSHAEAACDACHRPTTTKDANGRSFGRVGDTFAPAAGCARCHVDPHDGRFDGKKLPADVGGKQGCARCHVEASFRALGGFDHGKWTGFPLDGKHGQVGCAGCHAPLGVRGQEATQRGRTWGPAKGKACDVCHQDPHGGQFAQRDRVDCARCHKPAAFKTLVFNHNLDARFPLGDAHADVACAACHKKERIGARDLVRYRPLPSNCVDCHGVHEEQLRRRKRKGS